MIGYKKTGNRENYDFYDSNYIDRFTITALLTAGCCRPVLHPGWAVASGNLARISARVGQMMKPECFFKEFFIDTAVENAADTCPLSPTISERVTEI